MTGTVKWFDSSKGYGFITPTSASGKEEVFIHHRGILGTGFKNLNPGDQVEFQAIESERGPRAENLTVTKAA